MPIPVLKLNLAPPPTIWRQHHQVLGWLCLMAGSLSLVAVGAFSVLAYREAVRAGKDVVLSTEEARDVIRKQLAIQDRLRNVDVEKELPVWRLAERILSERSLPWSRLTAELERSLVQDVRLKSIQRTRNAAQSVDLKIRGEARSRAAEEAFVTELQKNPFFTQVVLERETDRQGGGVEFEYTLPVSTTPPRFLSLPKYGPIRTVPVAPAQPLGPAKPGILGPRPGQPPVPAPPIAVPATPIAVPAPAFMPPATGPQSGAPGARPALRGPTRLNPRLPAPVGQPSSSREETP